jgi:hypothetical protein
MKKRVHKAIVVFLFLSIFSTSSVKPLSKPARASVSAATGAFCGIATYFILKLKQKNKEEKMQNGELVVTYKNEQSLRNTILAVVAGVAGATGTYLALPAISNLFDRISTRKAKNLGKEISKDILMDDRWEITKEFIEKNFSGSTPMAEACSQCYELKKKILEMERHLKDGDLNDSEIETLKENYEQYKDRHQHVLYELRGLEGYVKQIEKLMCAEREGRKKAESDLAFVESKLKIITENKRKLEKDLGKLKKTKKKQ